MKSKLFSFILIFTTSILQCAQDSSWIATPQNSEISLTQASDASEGSSLIPTRQNSEISLTQASWIPMHMRIPTTGIVLDILKTFKIIKSRHIAIQQLLKQQNYTTNLIPYLLNYDQELLVTQQDFLEVLDANATNPKLSKRKSYCTRYIERTMTSIKENNEQLFKQYLKNNPQEEAGLRKFVQSRLDININENIKSFIRDKFSSNQPLTAENLSAFQTMYYEKDSF